MKKSIAYESGRCKAVGYKPSTRTHNTLVLYNISSVVLKKSPNTIWRMLLVSLPQQYEYISGDIRFKQHSKTTPIDFRNMFTMLIACLPDVRA